MIGTWLLTGIIKLMMSTIAGAKFTGLKKLKLNCA